MHKGVAENSVGVTHVTLKTAEGRKNKRANEETRRVNVPSRSLVTTLALVNTPARCNRHDFKVHMTIVWLHLFDLTRYPLTRLDRLLLLLDTGSSTSVRKTAAKQLAQLAAKSVISDVAVEEDIKTNRHQSSLGDPSSWAELMAVVARVRTVYINDNTAVE